MDRITKAVILLFIAAAVDRSCTLFPSDVYADPFLFYDMKYECGGVVYEGVNLQYIAKAVSVHARNIIALFAVLLLIPQNVHRLIAVFIALECLSVADFFIIYEQSFFSIGKYPVEFTDFKILGYALSLIAWKTGKL
jgi:hypothetical protein